jgi:hypothetical protein
VHAEARASEDAGVLGRLAGEAVELELEGGFSPEAFVAAGKARGFGDEREGELRAAGDEVYIRIDDAWYGHRGDGLDTVLHGPPPAEAERLVAAIEATGDELVDGDASEGPEVDGEETWQIEGKLNAAAAASVAGAVRGPVPGAELDRALEDARILFAAGRTDHLPRRIEVRASLGGDDLSFLGDGLPVEQVELTIEAELTDWGRPVTFERPAGARPFQELFGPLLLGLGLDGGPELDGAEPPVLAPPPPPQVELPPPPVQAPAPPPVQVPPPPRVEPPPVPGSPPG